MHARQRPEGCGGAWGRGSSWEGGQVRERAGGVAAQPVLQAVWDFQQWLRSSWCSADGCYCAAGVVHPSARARAMRVIKESAAVPQVGHSLWFQLLLLESTSPMQEFHALVYPTETPRAVLPAGKRWLMIIKGTRGVLTSRITAVFIAPDSRVITCIGRTPNASGRAGFGPS